MISLETHNFPVIFMYVCIFIHVCVCIYIYMHVCACFARCDRDVHVHMLKSLLTMQVNNEFKQEMNKYRDYMKALSNYKRSQARPITALACFLVMIISTLLPRAYLCIMQSCFRARFNRSSAALNGRHVRLRTMMLLTRICPQTILSWDTRGLMRFTCARTLRRQVQKSHILNHGERP